MWGLTHAMHSTQLAQYGQCFQPTSFGYTESQVTWALNYKIQEFRTFMMTIYFLLLSIVIVLVEYGNASAVQYFMFLNYGLG